MTDSPRSTEAPISLTYPITTELVHRELRHYADKSVWVGPWLPVVTDVDKTEGTESNAG